jgi:hypothetical protein
MKISINRLKDYIPFDHSSKEIADLLTASGLEVEGISTFESVKGSLEGIVIGDLAGLLPDHKVQLPPPPDFDEGKAPETWEDGSNSIYGLRRNLDQNVEDGEKGKDIVVKGYVQD